MSDKIFFLLNPPKNYFFSLHQETSVEKLGARCRFYLHKKITGACVSQTDPLNLSGFYGELIDCQQKRHLAYAEHILTSNIWEERLCIVPFQIETENFKLESTKIQGFIFYSLWHFFTKCDRYYYKMRQLCYYKMRQFYYKMR